MAPTTTSTPVVPARGKVVFQLKKLAQPLELEQDTIDHKWNVFKTFMVWIGGFLFLGATVLFGVLITLAVLWLSGVFSSASVTPTTTPVAVVQPATPVAPTQPQWNSYADCQRAYVLTLRQDPEGACDSFK